ncbi:hypothetical protein D3C78_1735580 [compost metagenome]
MIAAPTPPTPNMESEIARISSRLRRMTLWPSAFSRTPTALADLSARRTSHSAAEVTHGSDTKAPAATDLMGSFGIWPQAPLSRTR